MAYSIPVPKDQLDRILELAPLARLARRQHRETDPKAVASRELTQIFFELNRYGCSVSTIAKATGMTYHSVSARIQKASEQNA